MMQFHDAQPIDLIRIVHCHKSVFPDSLTSKMGTHYLSRMFSWYLSTDKTFLFFIEDKQKVIGYVGGMIVDGTLPFGSASSMIQHTFNDAVKALILRPWLLLHKDFLARYALLFRNMAVKIRKKFTKAEIRFVTPPKEPYTGLVVIGVHPLSQGMGYGSGLLREFERRTQQCGVRKMVLSVKSDNQKAIQSYLRNGWTVAKVENNSTQMEKRLI